MSVPETQWGLGVFTGRRCIEHHRGEPSRSAQLVASNSEARVCKVILDLGMAPHPASYSLQSFATQIRRRDAIGRPDLLVHTVSVARSSTDERVDLAYGSRRYPAACERPLHSRLVQCLLAAFVDASSTTWFFTKSCQSHRRPSCLSTRHSAQC